MCSSDLKGIPVSDEEYQLFPEDVLQEPAPFSPLVSLPAGYRSLGQIIVDISSMAASTMSRGPVLPSLGMLPTTPISSTPFVTSVPTRPTFCVAASTPIVIAQSSGVSTSVETSISMAIPDDLYFEEYRLAV